MPGFLGRVWLLPGLPQEGVWLNDLLCEEYVVAGMTEGARMWLGCAFDGIVWLSLSSREMWLLMCKVLIEGCGLFLVPGRDDVAWDVTSCVSVIRDVARGVCSVERRMWLFSND